MNKPIKKLVPFIFFTLILVFGLKNISDFGVSFDEHINRKNGAISANYVLNQINSILNIKLLENDQELNKFNTKLGDYIDRDYGVAIDLPVFIFERILKINDSKYQYIYRHVIIYLIFIIGSIGLYKIVVQRYENNLLGLLAVLMLVLSPRVYADAFYNIKDIVFMSVFIIGVLTAIKFINNPNLKSLLSHSIVTAIAIDIRIVAVIIPMATITILIIKSFRNEIRFKLSLIAISTYLFAVAIFTITLWPWLWESPINNFLEAFKNMSRFRWDGWIFFRGSYYAASEIPRYYLPMWIIITTPIIILILSSIGFFSIIKNTIYNKLSIWKTKDELTDLIILSFLILPIILVIIKKPIIYDGWRQFYFLYPLIIIIAIHGLYFIFKTKLINGTFKLIIYACMIINAIVNITWMHKSFPYWNVYFNVLAGNNWGEKFERDYWGLSNKEGLEYILKNDLRAELKIYGHGHSTIKETLDILDSKERKRIKIVKNMNDANYLIFNYKIFQPDEMDQFNKIKEKYKLFYEIKIDENSILTVIKF